MSRSSGGLVLLDKPAGITSFSALGGIKRMLGTGRVGHAGTLDKFASGLLAVLVGQMTRLVPYLTGTDKEYEAVFRFGERTETLDPEGEVVETGPVPDLRVIREQAAAMTGEIMQSPPVYSAVHVGGQRAYRLARRGRQVEIPERPVTIHSLDLLSYDPPYLSVRIRCSKGTYVRSIARDLGIRCGSCAYVTALRRTSSGPFSVTEAVSPDDFRPERDLLPPASWIPRLGSIRSLTIRRASETSVLRGVPLASDMFAEPTDEDGTYALFGEEEEFLSLAERKSGRFSYRFVRSGVHAPGD